MVREAAMVTMEVIASMVMMLAAMVKLAVTVGKAA